MTINVERDYQLVTLEISGVLDSTTAPNLDNTVNTLLEDTNELVFDMSRLEYISSAGIRVLLKAYKKLCNSGKISIIGINEDVRNVFEISGLTGIVTV